ncbi:hypothetical protein HDU98_008176 [Podochytrium sp. JEL0797]|nr:hypothetical protein HDU98_008176 [Podochytrium sp. JEL0797]
MGFPTLSSFGSSSSGNNSYTQLHDDADSDRLLDFDNESLCETLNFAATLKPGFMNTLSRANAAKTTVTRSSNTSIRSEATAFEEPAVPTPTKFISCSATGACMTGMSFKGLKIKMNRASANAVPEKKTSLGNKENLHRMNRLTLRPGWNVEREQLATPAIKNFDQVRLYFDMSTKQTIISPFDLPIFAPDISIIGNKRFKLEMAEKIEKSHKRFHFDLTDNPADRSPISDVISYHTFLNPGNEKASLTTIKAFRTDSLPHLQPSDIWTEYAKKIPAEAPFAEKIMAVELVLREFEGDIFLSALLGQCPSATHRGINNATPTGKNLFYMSLAAKHAAAALGLNITIPSSFGSMTPLEFDGASVALLDFFWDLLDHCPKRLPTDSIYRMEFPRSQRVIAALLLLRFEMIEHTFPTAKWISVSAHGSKAADNLGIHSVLSAKFSQQSIPTGQQVKPGLLTEKQAESPVFAGLHFASLIHCSKLNALLDEPVGLQQGRDDEKAQILNLYTASTLYAICSKYRAFVDSKVVERVASRAYRFLAESHVYQEGKVLANQLTLEAAMKDLPSREKALEFLGVGAPVWGGSVTAKFVTLAEYKEMCESEVYKAMAAVEFRALRFEAPHKRPVKEKDNLYVSVIHLKVWSDGMLYGVIAPQLREAARIFAELEMLTDIVTRPLMRICSKQHACRSSVQRGGLFQVLKDCRERVEKSLNGKRIEYIHVMEVQYQLHLQRIGKLQLPNFRNEEVWIYFPGTGELEKWNRGREVPQEACQFYVKANRFDAVAEKIAKLDDHNHNHPSGTTKNPKISGILEITFICVKLMKDNKLKEDGDILWFPLYHRLAKPNFYQPHSSIDALALQFALSELSAVFVMRMDSDEGHLGVMVVDDKFREDLFKIHLNVDLNTKSVDAGWGMGAAGKVDAMSRLVFESMEKWKFTSPAKPVFAVSKIWDRKFLAGLTPPLIKEWYSRNRNIESIPSKLAFRSLFDKFNPTAHQTNTTMSPDSYEKSAQERHLTLIFLCVALPDKYKGPVVVRDDQRECFLDLNFFAVENQEDPLKWTQIEEGFLRGKGIEIRFDSKSWEEGKLVKEGKSVTFAEYWKDGYDPKPPPPEWFATPLPNILRSVRVRSVGNELKLFANNKFSGWRRDAKTAVQTTKLDIIKRQEIIPGFRSNFNLVNRFQPNESARQLRITNLERKMGEEQKNSDPLPPLTEQQVKEYVAITNEANDELVKEWARKYNQPKGEKPAMGKGKPPITDGRKFRVAISGEGLTPEQKTARMEAIKQIGLLAGCVCYLVRVIFIPAVILREVCDVSAKFVHSNQDTTSIKLALRNGLPFIRDHGSGDGNLQTLASTSFDATLRRMFRRMEFDEETASPPGDVFKRALNPLADWISLRSEILLCCRDTQSNRRASILAILEVVLLYRQSTPKLDIKRKFEALILIASVKSLDPDSESVRSFEIGQLSLKQQQRLVEKVVLQDHPFVVLELSRDAVVEGVLGAEDVGEFGDESNVDGGEGQDIRFICLTSFLEAVAKDKLSSQVVSSWMEIIFGEQDSDRLLIKDAMANEPSWATKVAGMQRFLDNLKRVFADDAGAGGDVHVAAGDVEMDEAMEPEPELEPGAELDFERYMCTLFKYCRTVSTEQMLEEIADTCGRTKEDIRGWFNRARPKAKNGNPPTPKDGIECPHVRRLIEKYSKLSTDFGVRQIVKPSAAADLVQALKTRLDNQTAPIDVTSRVFEMDMEFRKDDNRNGSVKLVLEGISPELVAGLSFWMGMTPEDVGPVLIGTIKGVSGQSTFMSRVGFVAEAFSNDTPNNNDDEALDLVASDEDVASYMMSNSSPLLINWGNPVKKNQRGTQTEKSQAKRDLEQAARFNNFVQQSYPVLKSETSESVRLSDYRDIVDKLPTANSKQHGLFAFYPISDSCHILNATRDVLGNLKTILEQLSGKRNLALRVIQANRNFTGRGGQEMCLLQEHNRRRPITISCSHDGGKTSNIFVKILTALPSVNTSGFYRPKPPATFQWTPAHNLTLRQFALAIHSGRPETKFLGYRLNDVLENGVLELDVIRGENFDFAETLQNIDRQLADPKLIVEENGDVFLNQPVRRFTSTTPFANVLDYQPNTRYDKIGDSGNHEKKKRNMLEAVHKKPKGLKSDPSIPWVYDRATMPNHSHLAKVPPSPYIFMNPTRMYSLEVEGVNYASQLTMTRASCDKGLSTFNTVNAGHGLVLFVGGGFAHHLHLELDRHARVQSMRDRRIARIVAPAEKEYANARDKFLTAKFPTRPITSAMTTAKRNLREATEMAKETVNQQRLASITAKLSIDEATRLANPNTYPKHLRLRKIMTYDQQTAGCFERIQRRRKQLHRAHQSVRNCFDIIDSPDFQSDAIGKRKRKRKNELSKRWKNIAKLPSHATAEKHSLKEAFYRFMVIIACGEAHSSKVCACGKPTNVGRGKYSRCHSKSCPYKDLLGRSLSGYRDWLASVKIGIASRANANRSRFLRIRREAPLKNDRATWTTWATSTSQAAISKAKARRSLSQTAIWTAGIEREEKAKARIAILGEWRQRGKWEWNEEDDARVALATTPAHIDQIKALQMANLRRLLSVEVQEADGFVTAEYSRRFLAKIHESTPAIVSLAEVDGTERVVGYVLVATRADAASHDLLKDLVDTVDTRCNFEGKPLRDMNYLLVAQLCVDKQFRGQGLARKMYSAFAAEYHSRGFEIGMTDVAADNAISLKAHSKSGWIVVDSLDYSGVVFKVIVLPFLKV